MKLPWKFRLAQAWEILIHGTDTRYETCLESLAYESKADLSADRSYLAGLNRGYALGVNGDEQGFLETQDAYRREIHNHIIQSKG